MVIPRMLAVLAVDIVMVLVARGVPNKGRIWMFDHVIRDVAVVAPASWLVTVTVMLLVVTTAVPELNPSRAAVPLPLVTAAETVAAALNWKFVGTLKMIVPLVISRLFNS